MAARQHVTAAAYHALANDLHAARYDSVRALLADRQRLPSVQKAAGSLLPVLAASAANAQARAWADTLRAALAVPVR